jgi:NAD(P)-dependent dehydrogenase (short-subunit alcohol dehydrogenase family)
VSEPAAAGIFMAAEVRAANAAVSLLGRQAVVVGGTNGIGKGLAIRLAQAGASVTIVGRSESRGLEVVASMQKEGPAAEAVHRFLPCDCFLLSNVSSCVEVIKAEHAAGVDFLVCSQGMATVQGFTPTSPDEGLDQKMALHVFSRAAFARGLQPVMAKTDDSRFMSILSAGVHGPYAGYAADPELAQGSYSIRNAADAAGMYNDIIADSLGRQYTASTFLHVAPGFVATAWGTEMPWALRVAVRGLQAVAGRSLHDNAEYMFRALTSPTHSRHTATGDTQQSTGFFLVDQYGSSDTAKVTELHDCARESVWSHITAVLDAGKTVV